MLHEPEPTVPDRPPLEPGRRAPAPPLPAGSLGPAGILALQRTAGNAAVTALLSRRAPEDRLAREPAAPAEAAPPSAQPDWMLMSSDQPVLPGERVEGVPLVDGRYTEAVRPYLQTQLDGRFATNKQRGPKFADAFSSSVAEVWTSYVVEAMAEAAEGPPFYAEVLSFAARTVLLAAFPEAFVAKELGHFTTKLVEKGLEFAGELGAGKIAEHATKKKISRRGRDLTAQAGGIGGMIAAALVPIMDLFADEVFYDRFLKTAPPDELSKFRIPPEIPTVDDARMRAIAAAEMVGSVRYPAPIKPDQDNLVHARLEVRGPGEVEFTEGPQFKGAEAFAEALGPVTIGMMRRVPLYIELEADYTTLVQETLATRPEALSDAVMMARAYPSRSPAKIMRHPDGVIIVEGGGLGEHLHLYERAHTGEDLGALIVSYVHGDRVSPQPPQVAAKELLVDLRRDLREGADFLIRQSIEPRRLQQDVRLREPEDQ